MEYKGSIAETLTARCEAIRKAGEELYGQMQDVEHMIDWRGAFPYEKPGEAHKAYRAAMKAWEDATE